ncbi:MAG: ImmA/IrrE family metallo-endopeptidase [Oleispira sp.]|nr:ImmA/IrrE family metallo-endopeptidase [Oleispira sp.]
MTTIVSHPGFKLDKMLNDKGLSQRELSSKIDVAHTVLNQILKGNRYLNANIALSLEACGLGIAEEWMKHQIDFQIYEANEDIGLKEKNEFIKTKTELEKLVPLSYLKKHYNFELNSQVDIKGVLKIYNVTTINELQESLNDYSPKHFRKSSKFSEEPQNVYAWDKLAEYKAAKMKGIESFNISKEPLLLNELKECFLRNNKTVDTATNILAKYGIKFFILDKPSKTPVEGKSFLSGANPAIVLTLKYKRLDNFAFNLMHELGHVFKHLPNPRYKDLSFYTNNINTKEEREANDFAKNNLINPKDWEGFIYDNIEFNSDVIEEFSKKNNIHPAIVKGRICFEFPKYYKMRIPLSKSNVINWD